MKPVDIKSKTYINYHKESNYVRISEYKKISPKSYVSNLSKNVLVIKKVEN